MQRTTSSNTGFRSQSNPFSDPVASLPALPANPPVPPKYSQPPPSRSAATRAARSPSTHRHRDNVMEAVKDTVTVPPRTRPSRSHTSGVAPQATAPASRPQPRRSHSEESGAQHEKPTKPNGRSKAPKKGSQHADVIDRLDFTGVGPMFHHDGPFDACAPSRNKSRTKAPMYAWTSINPEDEQIAARFRDQEPDTRPTAYGHDSPYPSPEVARAAPYSPYYADPPKKKVDAIAEAWGMHEPEPYEEFFAGGGIRDSDPAANNTISPAGRDAYGRGTRRNRDGRREDDSAVNVPRARGTRRPTIPPPQPIFVADDIAPEPDYPTSPPAPSSPGHGGAGLGRNKSLMHRIRKMRDAPNVPVGYDDVAAAPGNPEAPSPTSSGESAAAGGQYATRPTHRPQHSFLGRLGLGRENVSPTSEAYVYVEDPKMKDLPATPSSPHRSPSGENDRGYFDAREGSGAVSSPGAGLGRKTSLMKKVKGVVRGGK